MRQLMHQVKPHARQLEVSAKRQPQPAQLLVVVPVHRVQRRNRAQRIEHVHPADIARKHDCLDAR